MRIAVLLGGIKYESQQRMVRGILNRSVPDHSDISFFICDAEDYNTRYAYERGEFNIYTLPDFSLFDAIILNLDTIHNTETALSVAQRAAESGKPCVSICYPDDRFVQVDLDNRNGLREVLEHLRDAHGVTDIVYISGPADNLSAGIRTETVLEFLSENGTADPASRVLQGDYGFDGGKKAVREYLASGRPLPGAFVAANDLSAMGALSALTEAGFRVPEDVLLTGYDDSAVARQSEPPLTTVARGEERGGELAYELAKRYVLTGKRPADATVQSHIAVKASCGCPDLEGESVSALRRRLMSDELYVERSLALSKFIMAETTGVKSFEDFLTVARRFIDTLNVNELYICINGDPEEYRRELRNSADGVLPGRDITAYSDTVTVAVSWKDGRFGEPVTIRTRELLPEGAGRPEGGNSAIFLPLHHLEHCFGYLAILNQSDLFGRRFTPLHSLILSNALASVFQLDSMNAMMQRLDELRVADELTGASNRAGAEKHWPDLVSRCAAEGTYPSVIFADIDALKQVNDRFGHAEGDRYILSVADALRAGARRHDLLFRYGGDEFVILTRCADREELETRVRTVRQAMEDYQNAHPAGYVRSFSVGTAMAESSQSCTLRALIDSADADMYRDKRRRRAKRKAEG